MSFQPVAPFTGLAGWTYLKRTGAAQMQALVSSGQVSRDADYFRQKIGSVKTADELVGDRRLLKVALDAFGLSSDIDNRYFIRKVLEDGTLSPDALANKLSDKRYLKLSKAFGFGDFATPRTQLSHFPEEVLRSYRTASFEAAVGGLNNDLRLALNADRELPSIAASAASENGKWYAVMSAAPLRQVVQTAFGLPQSFVTLDLDRQLAALKVSAERYLGTSDPAAFTEGATRERLLGLFFARSAASPTTAQTTGQTAALALLRGGAGSGLSRHY